jgi:hypothetical protein
MIARSEETPSVHGNGEPVETKLLRIAEKARKEPRFKFTSLYHLMSEELLRECFIHQSDCASLPEAGALCGKAARRDLCGGCRV